MKREQDIVVCQGLHNALAQQKHSMNTDFLVNNLPLVTKEEYNSCTFVLQAAAEAST